MSVSKDMQALRGMLGVETNADVILEVARLQATPEPSPERYIITVAWTEGTPTRSAQVNILQPNNAPILKACDALQAGLTVLNSKLGSIAAEAVRRNEKLQKQLMEERDASKVNVPSERVPTQDPSGDTDEPA